MMREVSHVLAATHIVHNLIILINTLRQISISSSSYCLSECWRTKAHILRFYIEKGAFKMNTNCWRIVMPKYLLREITTKHMCKMLRTFFAFSTPAFASNISS